MKEWFDLAKEKEEVWQSYRRYLHANAEGGFYLPKTSAFVVGKLREFGYKPTRCGRGGIVATVGKGGKTVLLRADMDGLPIAEQTGLAFACKTGKMHACGHDMHAAMLLGAAELLKAREDRLSGRVKLFFQPAEEILEGAEQAIKDGVLQSPKVDIAIALHVVTGGDFPAGTALFLEGVGAPSADYFSIKIEGKGCHGSSPWEGVDALTIAARILLGLQEIHARELKIGERAALTVGSLQTSGAGNVLPDSVEMKGTLRAYDETVREQIKLRLQEIAKNTAKAFRGKARVRFQGGCPTLKNDNGVTEFAYRELRAAIGEDKVVRTQGGGGASEDFAYIAKEVPSVMFALSAGARKEGFIQPLHHPAVQFDESAIGQGAAMLAGLAAAWLKKHK